MRAPDLLATERLRFHYGRTPILDDVTMRFGPGETVGLVGPNGAGKSTLVRCMLGLLRPRSGRVLLRGRDIRNMRPRERARHIAYVPQSSPPAFPLTVFETCLLGRTPHLRYGARSEDHAVVERVLNRLRLEAFAFRLVSELSGGERQRVMLARALIQETALLVLDEPTSALDIRNQLFTLRIIAELARERGMTAIVAIHDLSLAARFCDRLILLRAGRIHGQGTWEATLTEEAIADVYEVGAHVTRHRGAPMIVPYELSS